MRAPLLVVSMLGVLGALGCSDSATLGNDDGPCSLTEPCSDKSICDYTADGGPVCIPKDGDIDGDGLTNDKDFCQHQAGGAYDEDNDGIGDECDRCPIAPPRATPDSDADMVDAPCDPRPDTDGDEILLFDGFQGGLDPRWMSTLPSVWSVQGGELRVVLDTNGDQQFLKTNVVGKNSIAVEASYRVDRVETTALQHLVAVYADDPRPAGAAMMQCGATLASTTEIVVVETNLRSMNTPTTGAFESANLYRAGGYVTGTRAGCSVLSNGNPLGIVQTDITADQLSAVALTARAATVRFQYVIVVGH